MLWFGEFPLEMMLDKGEGGGVLVGIVGGPSTGCQRPGRACTRATRGKKPVTRPNIPWQVRSAVLVADPDATWQSYMRWEPNEWLAVTAHEDMTTRWWWIVEEPGFEFAIHEVDKGVIIPGI
jgi:hypothetical protein